MRFNLYHAASMAAVLAFGANAIMIQSPEEYDLAECYDDDYLCDDFAEIDTEVDSSHCPKATPCAACAAAAGKGPCPSAYEEGVKAKVQSALWEMHANNKLGGQKQQAPCGCLVVLS